LLVEIRTEIKPVTHAIGLKVLSQYRLHQVIKALLVLTLPLVDGP
jgi:hypothetical protein